MTSYPEPVEVDLDTLMAYLEFVVNRHRIWERRQAGEPAPWAEDPILAAQKFTNVFRVLDVGSQYVITGLARPDEDADPRDLLARMFLYRHTGVVEAWRYLEMELGRMPLVRDLPDVLRVWQPYRGEARTRPVFTGAYLVFPGTAEESIGTDKLETIIHRTWRLFDPGSPEDIMEDFLGARDQQGRFRAMRQRRGCGDFMAMQTLTDWGYRPGGEDVENEFVVAGPGARKGARTIAPRTRPEELIGWLQGVVSRLPNVPLIPDANRPPSLMDIQNTLCEWGKYVRFSTRPLSQRPYRPAHPGPQPLPVLPEHWGPDGRNQP